MRSSGRRDLKTGRGSFRNASDRIERWWSPAKWRDEHPEVSDGEGFSLDADQRLSDALGKERSLPKSTDAIDLGQRH